MFSGVVALQVEPESICYHFDDEMWSSVTGRLTNDEFSSHVNNQIGQLILVHSQLVDSNSISRCFDLSAVGGRSTYSIVMK